MLIRLISLELLISTSQCGYWNSRYDRSRVHETRSGHERFEFFVCSNFSKAPSTVVTGYEHELTRVQFVIQPSHYHLPRISHPITRQQPRATTHSALPAQLFVDNCVMSSVNLFSLRTKGFCSKLFSFWFERIIFSDSLFIWHVKPPLSSLFSPVVVLCEAILCVFPSRLGDDCEIV